MQAITSIAVHAGVLHIDMIVLPREHFRALPRAGNRAVIDPLAAEV
jgi:hypothetical protein